MKLQPKQKYTIDDAIEEAESFAYSAISVASNMLDQRTMANGVANHAPDVHLPAANALYAACAGAHVLAFIVQQDALAYLNRLRKQTGTEVEVRGVKYEIAPEFSYKGEQSSP